MMKSTEDKVGEGGRGAGGAGGAQPGKRRIKRDGLPPRSNGVINNHGAEHGPHCGAT